jgi:hypothetical protein
MDVECLAQRVKDYASSATTNALDDLFELCSEFQDAGEIMADIIPLDQVLVCVSRLVNAIKSKDLPLQEWKCLCFLVSDACYAGAFQMLTAFTERKTCRSMLAHCGELIATSHDDEELRPCFAFIESFMDGSEVRHSMMFNAGKLRVALVSYLTERFADSYTETQTEALILAARVAIPFWNGTSCLGVESFLRFGVLCAVKIAVLHVFSSEVTEQDTVLMTQAMWTLRYALGVAMKVPLEPSMSLSEGMYKFTRNDMFRVAIAVHGYLIGIKEERSVGNLDVFLEFVSDYVNYLLVVLGTGALQSFLLYKPARGTDIKSIAQLLAECAINCCDAWQENHIMNALLNETSSVPQLHDVLRSMPPKPLREWKGRRCELPDCTTKGEGIYNNLKKCARCMAVYYCCKEHQSEHWPEHRLACVKAAPATEEESHADR